MRKSLQAAIQRLLVLARDSNRQKREHLHPDFKRKMVSINHRLQSEERALTSWILLVSARDNTQSTHPLDYRGNGISLRQQLEDKALTTWIAEVDC
jgi:hypothetical protein